VISFLPFFMVEQTMAQDNLPPGRGGNGGSARVEGNGLAIGGPGGRVSGNARGIRGGDGGGKGSVGDVVVGGGGGHVAGPEVWLPPARSGYEVYQRALGLPVDPYLAQFGRGVAMPGYNEKLAVVDRIREDYLQSQSKMSAKSMYDVHSVPLEYINSALQAMNERWRARIFDDQFEFFLSAE
jgi:hypothetical protein